MSMLTAKTQWEACQATNSQCVLDASMPSNLAAFDAPQVCSQGSIPDYGVGYISSTFHYTHGLTRSQMGQIDVRTAEDVLAGYNFSKAHAIPLAIKNTGVNTINAFRSENSY